MIDLLFTPETAPLTKPEKARPWVRRWLKFVAAMIFLMVIVGGATRLTDSGLSITEWQPLLGIIPPLNAADWVAAFAKYQQSSEYKLQNLGMDMASFQIIYWWEWSHRLLGRLLGIVFLLPFLAFALTGRLERRMWPKLIVLFILGGLQGVLGWYMVASGLVDRVDVSQYRLAAHLSLAVFLYASVCWVIFSLDNRHTIPKTFDAWIAFLLLALILLQVASGGFVAGLDAGQGYNTWPLMDGSWIPSGLGVMSPIWRNLFENALTVQFDHRILAYVIFAIAVLHALRTFTLSAIVLAYAVFAQACLGILTLLLNVQIGVALSHQAGALIVVTAAIWNLHRKTSVR